MNTRRAWLTLGALLLACGGGTDPDAGPAPTDAALGDSGGGSDAGSARPDGAAGDAALDASPDGATDGGPPPPVTCTDSPADVYAIDPATVAAAAPGEVLACAPDGSLSASQMSGLISADGVTVTSGAARFLIAYRTERQPGVPGVGSALLLVPDAPVLDGPVVVVNHGTAGHADSCAPSTRPNADADLVLPWAASGLVTVAVDYAGLGTLGVQGYGDAFDTAQSTLDGARAALRYLREERAVVITGHSQGGGATLFAQGLAPTYAPELTVSHAIAFAGGSTAALDLTPSSAPLLGLIPITGGIGVNRVVFAMLLYADFANRLGEGRAGEGFHPSIRATMVDSMENDCIFEMALRLATPVAGYAPPNNFGQLVDPAFLTALQACVGGTAGCTPEGMAFLDQRTARGFIPVDPAGGDVLLISGSEDILHAPAEFACVLESVQTSGATVDACYLMGSTHFDITANGIGAALGYVLTGAVSCPASAVTPPDCAP